MKVSSTKQIIKGCCWCKPSYGNSKIDGDFGMHIKFWVVEYKKLKSESHGSYLHHLITSLPKLLIFTIDKTVPQSLEEACASRLKNRGGNNLK